MEMSVVNCKNESFNFIQIKSYILLSYSLITSSNKILEGGLLLLDEVIFVEFVAHIIRQVLPLLAICHVHVILCDLHGVHLLLLLLLDGAVAVLDILLLNPSLDGLLLHLLLVLLGMLIVQELIGLVLVRLLQLQLFLLTA